MSHTESRGTGSIDAAMPYLNGTAFDNSFGFRVGRSPLITRNQLLTSLVRGKSVLHVGCGDHAELIEQKRRTNTYLHDLLTESARHVVGLDVNAEVLAEMRSIGITELYEPDTLPAGLEFDLVLAPDVIEHVPNVGEFLASLRRHGVPVVITTPNALRMANRRLFSIELVNSDHRYWFSPYTLSKTLVEAGFTIECTWYTGAFAKRTLIRSLFARRYPLCRDGLAMLCLPTS